MTKPAHLKEIQDTFDGVAAFFSQEADYLSGTSSSPADLASVLALSSPNLDTEVTQSSADGTGYSVGSNQEATSSLSAVQREISMATSAKGDVYLSHQAELQTESTFYSNQGVYLYGVSSGTSTNGSIS